jgi:UDP-N-acetylmuramate--alanine ligase
LFSHCWEFKQAFVAFAARLAPGGALIACTDDPGASELLRMAATSGFKTQAYGLNLRPDGVAPDYLGKKLRINDMGCFTFELVYGEMKSITVSLQVPGEHNIRNALGALAAVNVIGLPIAEAARALGDFKGTGRRFDTRGVAVELQ